MSILRGGLAAIVPRLLFSTKLRQGKQPLLCSLNGTIKQQHRVVHSQFVPQIKTCSCPLWYRKHLFGDNQVSRSPSKVVATLCDSSGRKIHLNDLYRQQRGRQGQHDQNVLPPTILSCKNFTAEGRKQSSQELELCLTKTTNLARTYGTPLIPILLCWSR